MTSSTVHNARDEIGIEAIESLRNPEPPPVERSNLAPGRYAFQYRDSDAFLSVLQADGGKEVFQMHTTGGFGDTRGLRFADLSGNIHSYEASYTGAFCREGDSLIARIEELGATITSGEISASRESGDLVRIFRPVQQWAFAVGENVAAIIEERQALSYRDFIQATSKLTSVNEIIVFPINAELTGFVVRSEDGLHLIALDGKNGRTVNATAQRFSHEPRQDTAFWKKLTGEEM